MRASALLLVCILRLLPMMASAFHPDRLSQDNLDIVHSFTSNKELFRIINTRTNDCYQRNVIRWARINQIIHCTNWIEPNAFNLSGPEGSELTTLVRRHRFSKIYLLNIPKLLKQISSTINHTNSELINQFESFCAFLGYPFKIFDPAIYSSIDLSIFYSNRLNDMFALHNTQNEDSGDDDDTSVDSKNFLYEQLAIQISRLYGRLYLMPRSQLKEQTFSILASLLCLYVERIDDFPEIATIYNSTGIVISNRTEFQKGDENVPLDAIHDSEWKTILLAILMNNGFVLWDPSYLDYDLTDNITNNLTDGITDFDAFVENVRSKGCEFIFCDIFVGAALYLHHHPLVVAHVPNYGAFLIFSRRKCQLFERFIVSESNVSAEMVEAMVDATFFLVDERQADARCALKRFQTDDIHEILWNIYAVQWQRYFQFFFAKCKTFGHNPKWVKTVLFFWSKEADSQ